MVFGLLLACLQSTSQQTSFADNASESKPIMFHSKGPYKVGDVITLSIFVKTKFKIVGELEIEGFKTAIRANELGYFSYPFDYGSIYFGKAPLSYDPNFYSYSMVENSAGSFEYTLRHSYLVGNHSTQSNAEFDKIRISWTDEARQKSDITIRLASYDIPKQIIIGERFVPTGTIWKQKEERIPSIPSEFTDEGGKGLALPRLTENGTPIMYSLVSRDSNCSLTGFRFPGDGASQLVLSSQSAVCVFDAITKADDTYTGVRSRVSVSMLSASLGAQKKAEREKAEAEANRKDQIISVSQIPSQTIPLSPIGIPLKVSSDAMLEIFAYNNTNEICEFSQGLIKTKAIGRCVIAFSQEGNSEFKPAANVILAFNIVAGTKKSTITCIKGKVSKKVTSINPKCPVGYKKK